MTKYIAYVHEIVNCSTPGSDNDNQSLRFEVQLFIKLQLRTNILLDKSQNELMYQKIIGTKKKHEPKELVYGLSIGPAHLEAYTSFGLIRLQKFESMRYIRSSYPYIQGGIKPLTFFSNNILFTSINN